MVLVGCPPTSTFYTYKINDDESTSILIDAKQRAILAVPAPPEMNAGAGENGQKQLPRDVLVCAEPSPDAISVVSSMLSASVGMSMPSGGKVNTQIKETLKRLLSN